MDKKTALLTLLENSFIVPDKAKIALIQRLNTITPEQIDALGKLLAAERKMLVKNEQNILKRTKLLLDTLGIITK